MSTLRSLVSFIRKKVTSCTSAKKSPEKKDEYSLLVPALRRRLSMSVTADSPVSLSQRLSPDDLTRKPLLKVVMSNIVLHRMFVQWTEKEMSIENVQVYDLIQSYKRAKSNIERRREIAIYVKESFLVPGSLYQLNIREETVAKAIEQIEMGLFDELLFIDMESEVEVNVYESRKICIT
jgi:hypothetical protein